MEASPQLGAGGGATAPAEPIVVATDGLPQSRGAVATARAIAERAGSKVRAIAVYRSLAMVGRNGQMLLDPNVTAGLRADLTRRVREQCAIVGENGSRLDACEVLNGEPARVISEAALDHHARLIVVGIGRHALLDRVFGDGTALKIVRLSRLPVLAVPESNTALPKHAVIGVEFSEGSLRAAYAAMRLLDDGSVLELVHVVPRERLLFDAWVSQDDYMRYVRHALARFVARLTVPRGIHVNDVILSGDPARELLGYATRVTADLIATGSHGHGFVTRLIVGSVTTKLLRSAVCSVLVVPAQVFPPGEDGAPAGVTLNLERAHWRTVLDDFTQANAGRRTRLEVDDPELGAQAQEEDYPLLGVTFDPADDHVEIMLGDIGAGKPHLSRSVRDVEALDVLTDSQGHDVALRLRHGSGQTVLTLLT